MLTSDFPSTNIQTNSISGNLTKTVASLVEKVEEEDEKINYEMLLDDDKDNLMW